MNTKILKQKILQTTLNGEWKTVKLGEVCDYGKCKTVKNADIPDDAWVLDLEDIEKDTGVLLQRTLKSDKNTTSVRHSFKKGDVLYSKLRTYLNKVLVADMDGFCTTEIIPIDFKGKVIPEFARFVLMSPMYLEYTAQCGYGVKMPRLGTNDAKKATFPLPPLPIQRQIVSQIETLFAEADRIENSRNRLLQCVKLAKQKTLALMVSGQWLMVNDNAVPVGANGIRPNDKWKTVKLGEVLYPMETKKPTGTTFGYIDIDAIDNKQHIIKEPKIIDVANAPSRASRGLKYGDTLFSMVRPYLENIAFVEEKYADCIASTGFFVCRPKETILPEYLYYLMLSPFVIDGLNSFMKGDNSPSINNNNITFFEIPLPPLPVQRQIIEQIERIFAEIERIEMAVK